MTAALDSYGEKFVSQVSFFADFPLQLVIAPYGGKRFVSQSLSYHVQHRRTAVEDLAEFLSTPFYCPQPDNGEVERIIDRLRTWSEWKISPQVDAVVKRLLRDSGIFEASLPC